MIQDYLNNEEDLFDYLLKYTRLDCSNIDINCSLFFCPEGCAIC